MIAVVVAITLALAQRESDKVIKAFVDHCQRTTVGLTELEACLMEAPNCLDLSESRPGIYYVVGFTGNPHWVCSYEKLPSFLEAR